MLQLRDARLPSAHVPALEVVLEELGERLDGLADLLRVALQKLQRRVLVHQLPQQLAQRPHADSLPPVFASVSVSRDPAIIKACSEVLNASP